MSNETFLFQHMPYARCAKVPPFVSHLKNYPANNTWNPADQDRELGEAANIEISEGFRGLKKRSIFGDFEFFEIMALMTCTVVALGFVAPLAALLIALLRLR